MCFDCVVSPFSPSLSPQRHFGERERNGGQRQTLLRSHQQGYLPTSLNLLGMVSGNQASKIYAEIETATEMV
jgi:hypothetical protein